MNPPSPDSPPDWDECLKRLWDPHLSVALEATEQLYAPDSVTCCSPLREVEYNLTRQTWTLKHGETELDTFTPPMEKIPRLFWRQLMVLQPQRPPTEEERYQAVVASVWRVFREIRQDADLPFVEEYLEVALRPVRRLKMAEMASELCAAFHDYDAGVWNLTLMASQREMIRQALGKTLAALPPDRLDAFWHTLESEDATARHAMLLGLNFLTDVHAVPHLLHGLEQSHDPQVRSTLVDCLEKIADPRAIPVLTRLRRETALSDWPLARRIARALRVIEHQNRGQNHRLLLRPTEEAPDTSSTLLRPAADTPETAQARSPQEFLRPIEGPPEEKTSR